MEIEYHTFDGIDFWTETRTHDAQGRILSNRIQEPNQWQGEDCTQTWQYLDTDRYHDVFTDECEYDYRWELSWQADGDPVSSQLYNGAAATTLLEWIYGPNDDDHYERIETSYDGQVYNIEHYTWSGDLIVEIRVDDGADGTMDSIYTLEYDALGRATRQHVASADPLFGSGEITYTYTCN